MQRQHTTDISTPNEYKVNKVIINNLKKTLGFLSICVAVAFIIIGSYLTINNTSSYVNFYVFGILSRAPSLVIWMLYCLLYLRKYYPYQFLLLIAPLFLLSDMIWNLEAMIIRPCMIPNDILTIHFYTYLEVLICTSAIALIIIRPTFKKPNLYQIIFFLGFSTIYLVAGAPIVNVAFHINSCTSQYLPQNIGWELLWQIVYLISFGTIFTKNKPEVSIRWLFN